MKIKHFTVDNKKYIRRRACPSSHYNQGDIIDLLFGMLDDQYFAD